MLVLVLVLLVLVLELVQWCEVQMQVQVDVLFAVAAIAAYSCFAFCVSCFARRILRFAFRVLRFAPLVLVQLARLRARGWQASRQWRWWLPWQKRCEDHVGEQAEWERYRSVLAVMPGAA